MDVDRDATGECALPLCRSCLTSCFAGMRHARSKSSPSLSKTRQRLPESPAASPVVPARETQLPPKLRKKWIRRSEDALKEANSPVVEWRRPPDKDAYGADRMEVDDDGHGASHTVCICIDR